MVIFIFNYLLVGFLKFMLFFFSPLEQFIILPIVKPFFYTWSLFNISIPIYTFTITNVVFTFFVLFSTMLFCFFCLLNSKTQDLFIIPNRYQLFFENIFYSIISLLQDNIQSTQKKYFFPLIGSIFFFILNLNLIGIIPYTFTITSQISLTFTLSLFVFLGIQIIAIRTHGLKFFSLFFPSGVSIFLSFLLVPIEFISFVFKPISLAIRLFANMMAGHTLLKVIAGFTWLIMSVPTIWSLAHYIPLIILIMLFFLEVGVAIIQSFVFSVLLCIYINDIFNLH